jgi:hypothetical protein
LVPLISLGKEKGITKFPTRHLLYNYNLIVAHRPIAKQRLCKQQTFLGNSSINTFPLLASRILIMQ